MYNLNENTCSVSNLKITMNVKKTALAVVITVLGMGGVGAYLLLQGESLLAVVCAAIAVLALAALFLEWKNSSMLFTKEFIEIRDLFGREETLSWKDCSAVAKTCRKNLVYMTLTLTVRNTNKSGGSPVSKRTLMIPWSHFSIAEQKQLLEIIEKSTMRPEVKEQTSAEFA